MQSLKCRAGALHHSSSLTVALGGIQNKSPGGYRVKHLDHLYISIKHLFILQVFFVVVISQLVSQRFLLLFFLTISGVDDQNQNE